MSEAYRCNFYNTSARRAKSLIRAAELTSSVQSHIGEQVVHQRKGRQTSSLCVEDLRFECLTQDLSSTAAASRTFAKMSLLPYNPTPRPARMKGRRRKSWMKHLVLRLCVSLASFRPATILPRDQCLLPWVCPIISALQKKKTARTGQPQDRREKKKKTARNRTTLGPEKKKNPYREPVSLFSSYCDSLGDCAALRLALQAICH